MDAPRLCLWEENVRVQHVMFRAMPADFGDPPAGQVGELYDRPKIDGQVLEYRPKLLYLEDPARTLLTRGFGTYGA